jgi:hypothetical protein
MEQASVGRFVTGIHRGNRETDRSSARLMPNAFESSLPVSFSAAVTSIRRAVGQPSETSRRLGYAGKR